MFIPSHHPDKPVPDVEDVALARAIATAAAPATSLAILEAVLKNNVQRLGPASAPGATVHLDSGSFTLFPDIPTGSPTVHVTGSMSVTGTPGQEVIFSLVRDRGLAGQVVLTAQIAEIGATTVDTAAMTLDFLDTVDTVDAVSGTPFPLVEISTHIWSIVATAIGTLTSNDNAQVILEQMLSGHSATTPTPPAGPVNLGTAANFASFGSAGITTTGVTSITGDIGTPSTASSITGFALVLDGSGQFSTSSEVIGNVYAHDYAVPTPAKVTTANNDMLAAYTDASTRTPGFTNLFGGHLGGQTVVPGIYRWTGVVESGSAPAGAFTLNGAGVYIFQIAGTFDLAAGQAIALSGGALAQNVFWAIAGAVTLHAGSTFFGELLAATSIAMQNGATLHGRTLAQTGVTLIGNTIVEV
jgi:hypothetical protein